MICAASVPCGDYARDVFANLGITAAAMANVSQRGSDVTQVVGQVALGQADAGFVYITDAKSADGQGLGDRPACRRQAGDRRLHRGRQGRLRIRGRRSRFVDEVMSARGQAILRAAGFGAP